MSNALQETQTTFGHRRQTASLLPRSVPNPAAPTDLGALVTRTTRQVKGDGLLRRYCIRAQTPLYNSANSEEHSGRIVGIGTGKSTANPKDFALCTASDSQFFSSRRSRPTGIRHTDIIGRYTTVESSSAPAALQLEHLPAKSGTHGPIGRQSGSGAFGSKRKTHVGVGHLVTS
jgi:hypothetical protein